MKWFSALLGLTFATTIFAQTATTTGRGSQCQPSPTSAPTLPSEKLDAATAIIHIIYGWTGDIQRFNQFIDTNITSGPSFAASAVKILQATNFFGQENCMSNLLRQDDDGGSLIVSNLDTALQSMRDTMDTAVSNGGTCPDSGSITLDESIKSDWCKALTHTVELWEEIFVANDLQAATSSLAFKVTPPPGAGLCPTSVSGSQGYIATTTESSECFGSSGNAIFGTLTVGA